MQFTSIYVFILTLKNDCLCLYVIYPLICEQSFAVMYIYVNNPRGSKQTGRLILVDEAIKTNCNLFSKMVVLGYIFQLIRLYDRFINLYAIDGLLIYMISHFLKFR